jgi:hypothetical protein
MISKRLSKLSGAQQPFVFPHDTHVFVCYPGKGTTRKYALGYVKHQLPRSPTISLRNSADCHAGNLPYQNEGLFWVPQFSDEVQLPNDLGSAKFKGFSLNVFQTAVFVTANFLTPSGENLDFYLPYISAYLHKETTRA